MAAGIEDADGELEAAAGLYRRIRETAEDPDIRLVAMIQEGRLLNVLREDERAIEVLLEVTPSLRAAYLTALLPQDVTDAGDRYSKAGRNLTHSLGRVGRSREAFTALDDLRSLRLRWRQALRSSGEGRDLVRLEAQIYAADRGVEQGEDEEEPDPLARRATQLRERYRRLLPDVSESMVRSPEPEEVSKELAPDEVALFFGVTSEATMAGAIHPSDSRDVLSFELLDDWPIARWIDVLGIGEGAWFDQPDPRSPEIRHAFTRSMDDVEEDLRRRLAALIGDARRVHLVPHGLLHRVPWRALSSLADREVVAYPSIAQLMHAKRAPSQRLDGDVLVVGNPSGDLPLSVVEEARVGHHLSALMGAPRVLEGSLATEEAVIGALSGASIVHLSAHGRSSLLDPETSGVYLAPSESFERDPFPAWMAAVPEWRTIEDGWQVGHVPNVGRLTEIADPASGQLERTLDFGPAGTLVALYRDDELRAFAERWSAGDIMVSDALSECGLVVMSACETATAGLSVTLDEFSGLPAALTLAGVGTVIASEWPVPEGLAALVVDMIYGGLADALRDGAATATPTRVDVVSLVSGITRDLREMAGEEADGRLIELAGATDDPSLRFRIDAYRRAVARAGPRPFEHPFDCATFSVIGTGELLWEAH
jgi:CHAT domain-containing protein